MIQLTDVTKIYRIGTEETVALNHINLELEAGKSMTILGPSGSGKSTLMQIMGALDKPTSGQVIIDAQDISRMSDKQLSDFRASKLGFIFQMFNLQNYFTALENVCLPLIIAGKSQIEAKVAATEALERVGMSDRLNHKPDALSGGQMQRVAIARALVHKPAIILADEPTGNLDLDNATNVMSIIK